MKIREIIGEEVTQGELNNVEAFADRLWGKFGIDVNFTRHFFDRLNDPRNIKPISAAELVRLFKKEYARWGQTIAGTDGEAVMKDAGTDINLPFAKHGDRLDAKTIMRKNNFKTPDPEYVVEDLVESLKEPVEYDSYPDIAAKVNRQNSGKAFSGHTNVMATQNMRDAETVVIRFMDHDRQIQYHIFTNGMTSRARKPAADVDRKVGLDTMNIIFHDATHYLKRHIPIMIIATKDRYELYEKLANHLKDRIDPKLNIQSLGTVTGVDGSSGPAFKIFETIAKKNAGYQDLFSGLFDKDSAATRKHVSEKIKGKDGKACWDGYRYAGQEDGHDKCVKMGEDWSATNKKDKTDGMSQKVVDAYKRENPGSKLKTAVTKDNQKSKET